MTPKEKQKLTAEKQQLLKQMLNYSYEVETDGGRLVIGVMREGQLPRCADLLADTFVDTKGIQAYRRYVRRNILTYLEQHHKMPPAAVVLTAVLHSTVPQQQQQQTRVVQQLVGVAEVSFSESTRSAYLTLNPPRKCAYLCNMAVSNECRRKGVASHLIAAIEDMCNLAGERDVYLHLRIKDEATAGLLYTKVGFRPYKKDWPLLLLLGQEPRFLMRKQLPAARPLQGRVALPEQQQQQQEEGAAAGSVEREQEAAAVEAAASSAA
ncbi:hypothetical protein OEZ86_001653 [Tetradesmus obliquus]|nr:hypothetical protein OEZ86_001653 [Tetradesmus obliquus]